jgi:hypothetical protein
MREIKFKAKCSRTGKWMFGFLCSENAIKTIDGPRILIDKKTICQFVGLKDVKGNEIYENDIVLGGFYNGSFCEGTIVYHSNSFYAIPNIERGEGISEDFSSFEVVANKFDKL